MESILLLAQYSISNWKAKKKEKKIITSIIDICIRIRDKIKRFG